MTPYVVMSETWRPIPGYEGRYEASNMGNIKSLPNQRRSTEKILAQHLRKDGYLTVTLTGKDPVTARHFQRVHWVSRLVCLAFHGEPPLPHLQACHSDGVSTNNREFNLYWGTQAQNEADKERHGTSNRGSRNGQSKLTEKKVRDIKARLRAGEKSTTIADSHDIAASTVRNIGNGYIWSHIE